MYLANLIQVIYKTIHITLDLDILVTRDWGALDIYLFNHQPQGR